MKSVILTQPGTLEFRTIPAPEPPGWDDVQIRIHRVGICGTDFHAFARWLSRKTVWSKLCYTFESRVVKLI